MPSLTSKPIQNFPDKKINSLDTSNQKFPDKRAALRWYKNAVNGITSTAKMPDGLYTVHGRKNPFYGELALFGYDAKHKDTLPFWDAFPLIIVTNIRPNGFSGINLHYMPVPARKQIMQYLVHHKTRSKTNTSYARKVLPLLEQISQSDINFCYKNYLASHVRSKFVIVGNEYWSLAAELPLQQFQKATDKQVWKARSTAFNKTGQAPLSSHKTRSNNTRSSTKI